MKKKLVSALVFLMFWGGIYDSLYADEKQNINQKQTTPPPIQLNGIAQAAGQKGITKCLTTINAATNYLGFNNSAGALFTADNVAPDVKASSVVMEVPTSKSSPAESAIVSATFSTYPNGCQASYDAVIYWPDKCDIVIKKQFSALKYIRKLKDNVMQLEGPNINFFIMNAGKGCISLKKEIVG